MAHGVITHEEVLRHVYSFLHAYGYKNSLLALQNESRVPFNTIDVLDPQEKTEQNTSLTPTSPAGLERAVLDGQWDVVLYSYVDALLLPMEVLFDLYEHIFEELLTLQGFFHAARAFFTNSPVFVDMKRSSVARYARLQGLLDSQKNSFLDDANKNRSGPISVQVKEKRETILKTLKEAITWNTKPYDGFLPAALWRLQNDALDDDNDGMKTSSSSSDFGKRRRMDNSSVKSSNVASSAMFLHYPLQCPKTIRHKILFDNSENPTSCIYTVLKRVDDRESMFNALILGKTDGTVDFLDGDSSSPVGDSVGHTDGVLSITLDPMEENGAAWVAVGYRDGSVKIYNTETRKLVRRFSQVHSSGVTSLIFAGVKAPTVLHHRSWIVSGSFDGVIQVLDIREGQSIQRITDAHHSNYVLSLCSLTGDSGGIVSAGNDGNLCFWSTSSVGLKQVGFPRSLRSINVSLKEEVPTRLIPVEDKDSDGEVLVLTRGQRVLLLGVRFMDDVARPLAIVVHSTVCSPRPVYAGCLRVIKTPALPAPVLSVFLTDREGAILLYNVEMSWRVGEGGVGGGSRVELRPADETSIVVEDHGAVVEDLNVVNVLGNPTSLLAFSPSLPAIYVLSWSQA